MRVDPNCPECLGTDIIVLGDPDGLYDEVACVRCGELARHAYTHCSCCDEPIVQVPPEGEWSCACEWEGCDEDCPVVGHLYREQAR